jgi:Rps23 Pro-64 3,4-dihydroxylase Tpa1-like proline 4-hydroxylase
MVSNKLAVCIGDGSAYDKHYDNSGLDDTRKVTALYYMNFGWRPEMGGCFRIYNGDPIVTTDIEPIGDRLLVFWSDRLVHSVEPSFTPRGKEDHRYALTLWMTADSPDDIARDDEEVERHFGSLQKSSK